MQPMTPTTSSGRSSFTRFNSPTQDQVRSSAWSRTEHVLNSTTSASDISEVVT